MDESTQSKPLSQETKFHFLKNMLFWFVCIFIIIVGVFGLAFDYEASDRVDNLIGSAIFALLLAPLVTFYRKWRWERASARPGNVLTQADGAESKNTLTINAPFVARIILTILFLTYVLFWLNSANKSPFVVLSAIAGLGACVRFVVFPILKKRSVPSIGSTKWLLAFFFGHLYDVLHLCRFDPHRFGRYSRPRSHLLFFPPFVVVADDLYLVSAIPSRILSLLEREKKVDGQPRAIRGKVPLVLEALPRRIRGLARCPVGSVGSDGCGSGHRLQTEHNRRIHRFRSGNRDPLLLPLDSGSERSESACPEVVGVDSDGEFRKDESVPFLLQKRGEI